MTSGRFPSRPSAVPAAAPTGGSAGRGKRAAKPGFSCTECGYAAVRWVGRCPECQAWGSLTEAGRPERLLRRTTAGPVSAPAVRIGDVDAATVTARPSGLGELDRVLGGGLVPGGVVLLAGEPGVGKSTLLLSAAHAWASSGQGRVLIVTGEESAAQVRLRADRMGAVHPDVLLAAETELGAVLGHLEQVRPGLLIVDSVQTVADAEIDGSAGGVTQVKAVAAALTAVAKERGFACILVGHVTKDGSIAGPRVLEHLVDVVLHFEGDRHSALRMIRGVKNRFGAADEVGCFRMTEDGIVGLPDPSEVFLSGRRADVAGTCATIAVQGRRPMPVEIQALVGQSGQGQARRTISGLDGSRCSIVLAVLERWAGVRLADREVLAATVGGARMAEPAVDLAVAVAIWSSLRDLPVPSGLVVIGELGLSGEVRPVAAVGRRLAEAARLGFDKAVVPAAAELGETPAGMTVIPVDSMLDALRAATRAARPVQLLQPG